MVKRVFFSKKSYNLFLEFDTIICTPQLKVMCPGESAFPVDSQNVQDFYCNWIPSLILETKVSVSAVKFLNCVQNHVSELLLAMGQGAQSLG